MKEHYLLMYYPPREDFVNNQTKKESEVIGKHFLYLKDLYESGTVLMAGRINDARFGVALLGVEKLERAKSIMENDPAVMAGVFRAELLTFNLALGCD